MALRKGDLERLWDACSVDLHPSIISSLLKPTGRGGVYAARDYISALSWVAAAKKFNVDFLQCDSFNEFKQGIPAPYRFRLSYYTPCLASRFDSAKPELQKKIFESKDYLFTEKFNGIRGWLMHHKGKYYLFSRNYSDTDCSLLEYWANISQYPNFDPKDTFVIDVEVMYEPDSSVKEQFEEMGLTVESKLEACTALLATYPETAHKMQDNYKAVTGKDLINFRLITPIYYKGVNYIKRTLGDMMNIYNEVVEYARARGLNVKPIKHLNGSREQKQAFLDSLLEAGSEGIVAYNLKESYKTSENRDSTFVKLKRSVSGAASTAGIGDTIDGWISGFKMSTEKGANAGLIGSWEISVYVQDNGKLREHVIAYVPNIPLEIKKKCTVLDSEGKPTLREDFYNLIVELDGQCISAKSMRLTHPRMIRYRGDKIKEECIYSREFLESQIDHYFTE